MQRRQQQVSFIERYSAGMCRCPAGGRDFSLSLALAGPVPYSGKLVVEVAGRTAAEWPLPSGSTRRSADSELLIVVEAVRAPDAAGAFALSVVLVTQGERWAFPAMLALVSS